MNIRFYIYALFVIFGQNYLIQAGGQQKVVEPKKEENKMADLILTGAVITFNDVDMAEAALKMGANPDTKYKNTPLLTLAVGNNKAIVNLLLTYKADANSKAPGVDALTHENVVITPLASSVAISNNTDTTSLLLKAKADPDSTFKGTPVLTMAAMRGNNAIIESLIAAGANVNKNGAEFDVEKNKSYSTNPLSVAVGFGKKEAAEKLLKAGAHINIIAGDSTPLMRAVQEGNKEIVELLLQHGADPLFADAQGIIPRAVALVNGHKEIAKLLLYAEIEKSILNKKSS